MSKRTSKALEAVGFLMIMNLPAWMVAMTWIFAEGMDSSHTDLFIGSVISIIVSLLGWLVLAKVQEDEENGMVQEAEEEDRAGRC